MAKGKCPGAAYTTRAEEIKEIGLAVHQHQGQPCWGFRMIDDTGASRCLLWPTYVLWICICLCCCFCCRCCYNLLFEEEEEDWEEEEKAEEEEEEDEVASSWIESGASDGEPGSATGNTKKESGPGPGPGLKEEKETAVGTKNDWYNVKKQKKKTAQQGYPAENPKISPGPQGLLENPKISPGPQGLLLPPGDKKEKPGNKLKVPVSGIGAGTPGGGQRKSMRYPEAMPSNIAASPGGPGGAYMQSGIKAKQMGMASGLKGNGNARVKGNQYMASRGPAGGAVLAGGSPLNSVYTTTNKSKNISNGRTLKLVNNTNLGPGRGRPKPGTGALPRGPGVVDNVFLISDEDTEYEDSEYEDSEADY